MEKLSKSIREKALQMEKILSKLPLDIFCTLVLPELGIRWQDLKNAVIAAGVSISPKNIALILRKHALRMDEEELTQLIAILRIKLLATNKQKIWHTLLLFDEIFEQEPIANLIRLLPTRILHAARRIVRMPRAQLEVNARNIDDFIYVGIQMGLPGKNISMLYVAFIPYKPVAFITSFGNKKLIQAAVEGFGYRSYTNAVLYGPDLKSLIQIIDRPDENLMTELTEYRDDFSSSELEMYMDNILGQNPPLLNYLEVTTSKPFYKMDIMDKKMEITMSIESENIAETLKSFVVNKVLDPQSELMNAFHSGRRNRVIISNSEE